MLQFNKRRVLFIKGMQGSSGSTGQDGSPGAKVSSARTKKKLWMICPLTFSLNQVLSCS